MSNQESLLQQPALGKLAQRLLSLSVLSISVASIVLVVPVRCAERHAARTGLDGRGFGRDREWRAAVERRQQRIA